MLIIYSKLIKKDNAGEYSILNFNYYDSQKLIFQQSERKDCLKLEQNSDYIQFWWNSYSNNQNVKIVSNWNKTQLTATFNSGEPNLT